jgi:hypothetical protein
MAETTETSGVTDDERRGSDRKKLIVDVRFEGGDGTGIANTRDIGSGGLYMTTTAPLEVGAPIMMALNIGERTMHLKGTVVYSDPGHGVGVRFRDLTEADVEHLSGELQSL